MNHQVNLKQLAVERQTPEVAMVASGGGPVRARSAWLTRYLLPGLVIGGFLLLLGMTAGRQWWPARPVKVVPVVVKQAQVHAAGTPLFQAAGWIEPRPTAISVPALAAGVIDELCVVEGQEVAANQPIARLVDIDARLAVQRVEAQLAIRESELAQAIAVRDAAATRLKYPVHLEAELADAESQLALGQAELGDLSRRIEKAQTQLEFSEQSLTSKQRAQQAVAGIVLRQAEAEYATAQATLAEMTGRKTPLKNSVSALQRRASAVRQSLELLVDEQRQLREAEAAVAKASAMLEEAQVALAEAKLVLERMTVRAPRAGKVLSLVSYPGDRVMGIDSTSEHRSSTIVKMYDPLSLQVRADVRLEDVPLVAVGQPVQIETASSREVLQGRTLQATSAANIQKNTLEVKVELLDPPPNVTPEMLVTATFLAADTGGANTREPEQRQMLLAPQHLVQESEQGLVAWVVDAAGCAVPRQVQTGTSVEGEMVEIVSGLNPTDKLIASGVEELEAGIRVQVVGDDAHIGF